MIKNAKNYLWLIFICFSLGPACTSSAPYIFNPHEFNRESLQFNKINKDLESIKICHKYSSNQGNKISKIAQKKCGEYGKIARFVKKDLLDCPLLTPTGSIFSCVKP